MTMGHFWGAMNFSAGCNSTPVTAGEAGGFFWAGAAAGETNNNPNAIIIDPSNLK
jgi:hypothetical protein